MTSAPPSAGPESPSPAANPGTTAEEPQASQSHEHTVQTAALVLISAVLVAAALFWLRAVMIPFVLATFVWLAVRPLVQLLERRLHLPRLLAVLVSGALAISTLVLLGSLISASFARLAEDAPLYRRSIEQLGERSLEWVPEPLRAPLLEQLELRTLLERTAGSVGSLLVGWTNAMLGLLQQSFLVLIFVSFLLLGGGEGRPASGIWGEIERQTQRYLVGKAAISSLTGGLVAATLAVLGVDLALVFGLLAFLLNFIPSIGSVIATLLPLPIVAIMPDATGWTLFLALVIPGAIQLGIGNVLEPRLMGESLGLHPVSILLALIFWGTLWGVVGMLLATPITAIGRILMDRFPLTRPVARLMAGHLTDALPEPEPRP